MSKNTRKSPPTRGKFATEILRKHGIDADPGSAGYKSKIRIAEVAHQVKEMRLSSRLSQKELADRTGMTQADISRLESGLGTKGPSIDTLERLAAACDRHFSIDFAERSPNNYVKLPNEIVNKVTGRSNRRRASNLLTQLDLPAAGSYLIKVVESDSIGEATASVDKIELVTMPKEGGPFTVKISKNFSNEKFVLLKSVRGRAGQTVGEPVQVSGWITSTGKAEVVIPGSSDTKKQ